MPDNESICNDHFGYKSVSDGEPMALRQAQKRKPLRLIVFVAAIFGCLLLLLPTLLSTAPLNNIVVNVFNRHVAPANLTIEALSFGWFSHQSATHVQYNDIAAGVQVDLPAVTVEKSLLSLLLRRTGPGFVHLESPQIVVPLKRATDFNLESTDKDDQDKDPLEDGKGATGQLKQLIRKFLAWGGVSFNKGQIFGITKSDEKLLLLDQVLLQTRISKKASQAVVRLSAKSGQRSGTITGNFVVTLPDNGMVDSASFVGQGHLAVNHWNLEESLPLAAFLSDQIPFGRGRLTGKLRMENPSGKTLKLTGDFKAKNVVLYGGFLRNDRPEIAQINGQLNALRQNSQWSLSRFQFDSPLANGTASGVLKEQVKINTRINIAPTLKQLPNTLNIRDDLAITNGSVQISGSAAFTQSNTQFDGKLTLSRLEGEQGKRKFAWKKPLTIRGQGTYSADGWAVKRAKITSPFLNGNINATSHRFESRMAIDAAQTFKQVDQFFKVPPIALQGLLKTHLTAQKRGKGWDLNMNAFSKALKVHSGNRTLSAATPFQLEGKCQYRIENRSHRLTAPELIMNSGLLNGHLKADLMQLLPNGRVVKIENATVSGKLDNREIGAVYSAVAGEKPKLTILGDTRYEAAFEFNQDQINFHHISLMARPLQLDLGRQSFADKNIELNGSGVIDVDQRSAAFKSVNITTSAGESTLESLKLGDLRDPFDNMKVKGAFKFDVRELALMFGLTPEHLAALAGQGEAMVESVWQDGMLTQLSAKGIVAPLKWHFDDKTKIDEPKVVWDMEMGPGNKRVSVINRLLVKSNLISLNGTGVIYPAAPKTWLQLKGNVDANLEKLSAFISRMAGQAVAFSGKIEVPFKFKMGRKNNLQKKWLHRLNLETHFPARRLTTMGITLEQMTIPTIIQNGKMLFDLKATVNDGNVTLAPSVDLNRASRLIASEGVVFNKVRVTQSLIDKVLARLHPLFIGTTTGQGVVGLYLNKLDWPLTDNSKFPPILDGRITFNKVVLKSSKLIDEILIFLKADRRNITIENDDLTFSYRDGRVVTSPLFLKTDDTTIVLEGSMGHNQTLDFVVRTPISKKMVSDTVYPLLANSVLTIPIGGTASNPQVDRRYLYAELERLVKEASGEALKKEAEGLLDDIFKPQGKAWVYPDSITISLP